MDTALPKSQEICSKEGHCNVQQCYYENKQLGIWVSNQTSQNKLLQEGKQSSMTEDRKYLLESIGFVWELNKDTWTRHFQNHKKYVAKEGHCNVQQYYYKNKQLGIWVMNQRSQNRLLQERKQ